MKRKRVYERARAAAERGVPQSMAEPKRSMCVDYFAVGWMRGYEAARRERGRR